MSEQQFLALPWLAIKVLTPSRVYVFHDNKPQVDYILLAPNGAAADYEELAYGEAPQLALAQ